jgi:hypothetical protein
VYEASLKGLVSVAHTIPRMRNAGPGVLKARDGFLLFLGFVEAKTFKYGRRRDDSGWPVVSGPGEVEELLS